MTETTFNVQIPSQLLNLGLEQEEIQRRISEWLVFSLFSEGKVSSGKAGKLLGISRIEFIQLLKTRGIAFINYSENEVKEELQATSVIKSPLHEHPAFGSWKNRDTDSINYQNKIRSDWE